MSRFLLLNAAALAGSGAGWALSPEAQRLPVLAGVGLSYAVLFANGVANPRSSLFVPVRSRGKDYTKLALTFDDGPGDSTRQVLGVLRENVVPATFFVVGENLRGREEVVRAAHAQGCTIGSHTFRHSRLTNFLLPGPMTAEIKAGVDAVEKAIGKRPRLYRPPVGLKSPAVGRAARALDLCVVGWQRRALDGGAASPEPATIVGRLLAARGGDVLLLHDGAEPGRPGKRDATVQALRELIPLLKSRGFSFATVDQLLGERPYA